MNKAKYELRVNSRFVYSFITHQRNCEDAINILLTRFEDQIASSKWAKIYQTQLGKRKFVWFKGYHHKVKQVIDIKADITYPSMTAAAEAHGISYKYMWKLIMDKNNKRFDYVT